MPVHSCGRLVQPPLPVGALVCGAHLSPPEARPPTFGAVTGMASLRSLPGGSQKPLFGSYLGSTQARDASTHGPSAQAQGGCEGRVGARAGWVRGPCLLG